MAAYSNFRSSNQIEVERQELREARKKVLDKAKEEYEKSERRREKARQAGEGTWMLSSVTDRIEKEQKALERVKEKKKKKDKKKKKKHKKEKKRKRHSSSSDTESSGEEEAAWVVKDARQESSSRPVSGPTLQRDSWMEGPLVTDLIPTVTRAELRERKRGEEEQKKAEAAKLLEQPGQHTRELNPYWKDGGMGLPENTPTPVSTMAPASTGAAGDGGLSWLRKAYQRCQQQAKEEGRSLEDVAADRYGSLEKLTSMIQEAENARGLGRWRQGNQRSHGDRDHRFRSRSPSRRSRDDDGAENAQTERGRAWDDEDTQNTDGRRRDRDHRERRDRDEMTTRDEDRWERERKKLKTEETSVRRNRERDRFSRDWRKTDKSDAHGKHQSRDSFSERQRFVRPDSDDDDKPRSSHKRGFLKPSADEGSSVSSSTLSERGRFRRPNDNDEDDNSLMSERGRFRRPNDNDEDNNSLMSERGRFRRPNDNDEDDNSGRLSSGGHDRQRRDREERERGKEGGGGGWRKRPQLPAGKETGGREVTSCKHHRRRSASASSDGKSGSSSTSSESDSSEEEEKGKGSEKKTEAAPAAVKMLSEDEMNSLGARILRAELMGDEDLANQLKAQLEQAQKAKQEGAVQNTRSGVTPNPSSAGQAKEKDDDDNDVVVLTRTGRDGMVRPLPEQEYDQERGGKKKRKKQKLVDTHGRGGERTRYFDDDDRHDLKTLVQMEKLGTAEDQNAMFSRLAGRSAERTDDDFQVDDMFLSKAAKQQSGARNEEKERSKAIFEHRKVNAAMEKCQFCFNKIPKHLLIAIGNKVYLSLPAHRSLTPGHCLLVPMQHVSAATALDEDVWQEMQTFRKQLVQMFASQDQDVVFMETSMHHRYFPHMVLECIPMEREIGDLSPIYFKKAMQEAGPEWSHNRKVVDLSQKDIRHSVPKGFPYFSVDFGLQGGFAHVIEDEKTFPSYFGREIVGGMLDADPGLWRKPHREGFEDQRRKVLEFEKWWRPFDFTAA